MTIVSREKVKLTNPRLCLNEVPHARFEDVSNIEISEKDSETKSKQKTNCYDALQNALEEKKELLVATGTR